MTRKLRMLLNCSIFALLPFVADAAGTYYNYNGTVQRNYNNNPFYNYGPNNAYRAPNAGCQGGNCQGNMNNNFNNNRGYDANNNFSVNGNKNNNRNAANYSGSSSDNGGFRLDAGLSHQFAEWRFEMANAGSILHYDNVNWNVFDASAVYDFNWGDRKLRLNAGLQYGVQYDESTMVDDDITGGGFVWGNDWSTASGETGTQQGHALSVGTSADGDMFGLHAGIGFVDVWRMGNFRLTPSIGYRYFKYKLETKRNYGLSIDTFTGTNYCKPDGGETQCMPFLVFLRTETVTNSNGQQEEVFNAALVGSSPGYGYIAVPNNILLEDGTTFVSDYVEPENTYYYYQDGISHSYEVEWSGPYIALDMVYDVSADDELNARLELGLPAYTSTADQPYRPDWQHPKSLEDKGSIGDAYHFGLGANWLHSLSNSVMLTLGLTFDYYHVSGADATTYLNSDYYITNFYYNEAIAANEYLIEQWGSNQASWSDEVKEAYDSNLSIIEGIDAMAADGWKSTAKDEIESFYKSMGVRIGIRAKF